MAYKKRVKELVKKEGMSITTEYSRKSKGVKKHFSLIVSGLLLSSVVVSSGATVFANTVVNNNTETVNVVSDESEIEEFNTLMTQRAESRGVKESKLAGSDRYKTAVTVSKAGWSTSKKAILINGTALSDALTSTPLAEEYNAPILLTEKDKLNADTLTELKRLGVQEITLIGGDGVISTSQENTLKSLGFKVERIGGIDRVETSYNVAMKLKGIYASKGNTGRKVVFVANGIKGLSDATSVASPAGFKDAVILYTNGTNLNGIKRYIETSADDVYLIGGVNVISSGVESELKNTTNKRIIRLAGDTRKDTNAKVISEFFPNNAINKMYVAKDGSGSESELVDALAVGSLAGKEKNPVLISSGDLSASQKTLVNSKAVSEVVQVGDGVNTTATKQVVGIINAVAEPEPSDGMKLPSITFAKEQNVKFPFKTGGYACSSENRITGDLYVKYGNPKADATGIVGAYMHTYGSANQEQYNKVVTFVKDALKSINFRYQPEWVYMQHYLNGGKADSFVDPILSQKGINTTYGQWKANNINVINGITSGKLTKAQAETLAMYSSAVAHVESKTNAKFLSSDDGWMAWSAYQVIFEGIKDEDSLAELRLIVADMLGLNAMVAGHTTEENRGVDGINMQINVGNYWWTNGKSILLKSNTTQPLLKSEYPKIHVNVIWEAPTVDGL